MKLSFPTFVLLILGAAILSGCASTLGEYVYFRDYKAASKALEKGADPNASGQFAGTYIPPPICEVSHNYAEQCPNDRKFGLMVGGYGDCTPTLEEQMAFAEKLIAKGALVNIDCEGSPPLLIAIRSDNMPMVELLVRSKVSLQSTYKVIVRGYFGGTVVNLTPLMYASLKGKKDIARFLIAKGANPSQKSSEGKNANDYYEIYLENQRIAAEEAQRREEAAYAQRQRDKEESRAFWRGAATLATGVAVGNSTRNLSSDQQTQMMRSSMQAVQSGDASGLADTSNQIKAGRSTSTSASTIGGSTSNSSSSGTHYNLCSSRTDGYCSGGACTCNGPVAYGVCPSGYRYSATFRSMADCRTRLR